MFYSALLESHSKQGSIKNPEFCHLHLIIFIPYIDNSDGDLFIKCPPKRPCLASLDVNTVVSSSVRTNCSMSVAEHSSNIPIGGLSGDSREHAECIEKAPAPNFAERLENYFISGTPLCPEELLIYSLMKLQFKTYTFNRHHSISQYVKIADVVSTICGAQFEPASMRRFFPRIANNELKSNIGKENGKVRWSYFGKQIDELICVSRKDLEQMLNSSKTTPEDVIVRTSDQLRRICSTVVINHELQPIAHTPNFSNQFFNLVKPLLATPTTSCWVPWFDSAKEICHIYRFDESPGYAEVEIRVLSTGEWVFYSSKIERDKSKVELLHSIPAKLNNISDLAELIKKIDVCKFCVGCGNPKEYKDLNNNKPYIYKKKDGTDGVRLEENTVFSADCKVLVPTNSTSPCEACQTSRHYLRTLVSRGKTEETAAQNKVKARYDYKSRGELLEIARESEKTIKRLKTQNRRLEDFREKMVNVGPNSNEDLKRMFVELQSGLDENRMKFKKPVCQWDGCHAARFENVEELYRHCKIHVDRIDTGVVPPIQRCYNCKWNGCKKQYAKLKLLENHIREHTGSLNEEFLEILLSDQAKAIKTESRQMRWHPIVIKWCLRIYLKSHRLYDDLRHSGGLKLPSGRTLSAYNNFCAPKSGWQTENLRLMKENFHRMKPPNMQKLEDYFMTK